MRLDNINYPSIDWVKNKKITSPIDYSFYQNISGKDKARIETGVNHILSHKDLKVEYASQSIIDIIDLNTKNIESFGKIREEDKSIEGYGLFLYTMQDKSKEKYGCSIFYEIINGNEGIQLEGEDIPEGFVKTIQKTIFTYNFVGNRFFRSFIALALEKDPDDDKGKFYVMDSNGPDIMPQMKLQDDYYLVEDFLIFKKYAELQTKICPPKTGIFFNENKYVNNSSKGVTVYDSNYFTNIIRSEGFGVRGHFRLQRIGEGRTDKRLIWINDFQKEGYTRTAKINKDKI